MRKTKTLTIIAAAMISAAACSVKEDRSPCPCWLSIDFGSCSARTVSVAAWNDSHIFSERIAVRDYSNDEIFERTVPKGYVNTSVIAGEREMERAGTRLTIPLGHDADSIWAHAASVECLGEFARDTALLHKQFARVFMKVEVPQSGQYPYSFSVTSDVCGMDMRDLMPVEGTFMVDLVLDEENTCMFCLPRQREDGGELKILIHEKGQVIETIPLAAWVNDMGYSWVQRDLEDIYIGVDYARAEVSISVNGWDNGDSFKVEI